MQPLLSSGAWPMILADKHEGIITGHGKMEEKYRELMDNISTAVNTMSHESIEASVGLLKDTLEEFKQNFRHDMDKIMNNFDEKTFNEIHRYVKTITNVVENKFDKSLDLFASYVKGLNYQVTSIDPAIEDLSKALQENAQWTRQLAKKREPA